ncbi:AI-2E family transporter [Draconibacterium sp.]|jgi:predicted PurR-regulated permease PerM
MKLKPLEKVALSLFIFSVVIAILVLAKVVLIPLAISVFLTYMLYPLTRKIEGWGVHRGVAISIVLLITLMLFAGAVLFVSVKVSNTALNVELLKERVDSRTDSIMNTMENELGLNRSTIETNIKKATSSITSSWQEKVGGIFSKTTTTLFQIGILPVFIFFLLYYRTKTAYFIFRLVGRHKKRTTLKVLKQVANVATKYLTGQLLVILVLSVLNTIGLYIIGVPNGIIFGILAAVLNLIPYLGMFMGNVITIVYVLFTVPDSSSMAVQVFLVYTFIQFLENNLITPNIVGNNIKINPLAIIIGVLLANLVWGIAGMLIIIPFLAIMKIIMQNVDDLKPFAYLISDRGTEKQKIHISWWSKLKSKFTNK